MNNDYNGIPFLAQSCHLPSEDVKYSSAQIIWTTFMLLLGG